MTRLRQMTPRVREFVALALGVAAVAGGCGGHESATTTVEKGVVPSAMAWVFLATELSCNDLRSEDDRFTPLVVRGPGYATTIEPFDGCRKQRNSRWWSYGYYVPVPVSGQVRLTPGNQPTATLDVAKLQANNAATIYYVNCSDSGEGGRDFRGRISSIEYFKDDDVSDVPT
jgi:hypothetical protein